MSDNNRLRWRDQRETVPARQKRRRRRRRDIERGGDYLPDPVGPDSAARGVRTRLRWAFLAVLLTATCFVVVLAGTVSGFGLAFLCTAGITTFSTAVGLLLSARSEEKVHEMATRLDGCEWPRGLPPGDFEAGPELSDGSDGSVEAVGGCSPESHAGPR